MIITAVARITAVRRTDGRITAVARITAVRGMDGRITAVARTDPVMPLILAMVRAQSRSRLEIGRTILTALVIMWAAPITFGARDIGHGATVKGSGSAATTF